MNAARVAAKLLFAASDIFLPKLRGPRILIYHQVGSGRTHEMNVEVAAFRRQIEWMTTHGEIVSLEEAVRRRDERDADRFFVLTFDDGYADVFVNAFPLLAMHRVPFTLYLTSGPIENPGAFPTWPGDALAWDQVCKMIDSGLLTVGAHTHTHPDMRQLSRDAVIDELDRSNELIAQRTGVVPNHFTYPKGKWARQAHDLVCARYLTATLGRGIGPSDWQDLHLLNRIPAQRSDLGWLFSRKMHRGGLVEERVRRRLHSYDGP